MGPFGFEKKKKIVTKVASCNLFLSLCLSLSSFYFILLHLNIVRAITLVCAKDSVYQSINTLLFPLNNPFFTPSLSLSLPLFLLLLLLLFFIFFLFFENLFLSSSPSTHYKHSINTDLRQPITDLH